MRRFLGIGIALSLLTAAAVYGFWGGGSYTVQVALQSGTNIVSGTPVLVNGFDSGTISSLEVRDGRAFMELDLDDEVAPLHEGAIVKVVWKAVLSERLVTVEDGPPMGAEIPDGGMLEAKQPKPTELDHVLNALDEPTRVQLSSLVQRMDTTLGGSEQDINATVTSAGPALASLGNVLQALGTDGPAIRALITRMNGMLETLATREQDVQTVVEQLSRMSNETVQRRQELGDSLTALPPTLVTANETLGQIPSVVDEAKPLLDDLEPATARLPSVARNLRPLLTDLRPLTAELRPTLEAAQLLFDVTPGLLDTANATAPALNTAVDMLEQPVNYLRPYTPEAVGFLSNWGTAFSSYDSNGKFARVHGMEGTTSFNEMPGIVPPGITYDPYPLPGAVVDEAWTDAFGGEIR